MKEWYYTITESMLDYGLMGTELNLFAIIFCYSQKGDGCCYATREELARRCGVKSRRTIDAALAGLIEKGLVRRFSIVKDGKSLTSYSYTGGAKIAPVQGADSAHPPVQKLRSQGANSAHKENKEENKSKNITPSLNEVADYAKSQGFADPAGFADYYIRYQTENGWMTGKGNNRKPIDNWKLNVLAWRKNHKDEIFSKPNDTTTTRVMTSDEFKQMFK